MLIVFSDLTLKCVLVQVLWEADTKLELQIERIYWIKCYWKIRGETEKLKASMLRQVWQLWKTGKKGWVVRKPEAGHRARKFWLAWPQVQVLQPRNPMWKGIPCFAGWVCIIMPIMFSHWKCESYAYWLGDGSRRGQPSWAINQLYSPQQEIQMA